MWYSGLRKNGYHMVSEKVASGGCVNSGFCGGTESFNQRIECTRCLEFLSFLIFHNQVECFGGNYYFGTIKLCDKLGPRSLDSVSSLWLMTC